ncbi:MAG: hypothetical protein KKB34_14805 [Bacteroidetes bacterium]|nr:hypothetical protein [Bacteroidota bacterium]
MEKNKYKSLFFYLNTGGGHLAPAKSVAQYLRKYNDTEIILLDGFDNRRSLHKYVVEDGYRILQNRSKWIYELTYAIHKFKPIAELSAFLISISIKNRIKKILLNEKPDQIVIFHFLLIKPIYKLVKKLKINPRILTVVTDPYIAHPLWFLRKNQNFIVFSDKLKDSCIKSGIESNRINVFPFLVNEKFSHKATPEEIINFKRQLGYEKDKVLLILGGGDGIPHGYTILENLLKLKGEFDIAFVCGKNKQLYNDALELKNRFNYNSLKVYSYVDFIYELISISDVIITKCGASTLMEILISGKIPIVNSYIWEQEKGNVDFMVENNLGIYEKRVSKLPSLVNKLLNDPYLLTKYGTNNKNINLVNGTVEVSEFVYNNMKEPIQ